MTDLPAEIVRRPKLLAGRATSPRMIDAVLSELQPRVEDIAARHPTMESALLKQPTLQSG